MKAAKRMRKLKRMEQNSAAMGDDSVHRQKEGTVGSQANIEMQKETADMKQAGTKAHQQGGIGRKHIDEKVKRFKADSYFGMNDRCVPVVLAAFAGHSNARCHAIPVEEYIAEQLDYRVADDLVVLNSDGDLKYDETYGLLIPDSFDGPCNRRPDGLPVYSYSGFTAWSDGADDDDLEGFIVSETSQWPLSTSTGDMSSFTMVQNDGERLVESDYWDSEPAHKGLFFASFNAGHLRLLVPDSLHSTISEILTGKYAVVTHGLYSQSGRYLYEIMFEDGSSSPYCLMISPSQFDREFSIAEAASQDRKLIVYRRGCVEVTRMPVFFREAARLPCLKPLKT